MKKLPTILKREEAEKLAAAIRAGQLGLMAEMEEGKLKIIVRTLSGSALGVVGERWTGLFKPLVVELGAGDGLFPGFSQTVAA